MSSTRPVDGKQSTEGSEQTLLATGTAATSTTITSNTNIQPSPAKKPKKLLPKDLDEVEFDESVEVQSLNELFKIPTYNHTPRVEKNPSFDLVEKFGGPKGSIDSIDPDDVSFVLDKFDEEDEEKLRALYSSEDHLKTMDSSNSGSK